MRVRVLGSSGGIGGRRRTTAFLVDDDLLIDAGSGVGDLTLEEMAALRSVFLTHSHLDHVAGLFLLLDSTYSIRTVGVEVHALPQTLDVLSRHLSNDEIWPDFRRIPSAAAPMLVFKKMTPGEEVRVRARGVSMIEVCHSVPAAGYLVVGSGGAFAFSGDTGSCPAFWETLNRQPRLDRLFVEVSFPDSRAKIAEKSGHYHPASLARDLERLTHRPEIWLTHLKPGMEKEIEADCRAAIAGRDLHVLRGGEQFTF